MRFYCEQCELCVCVACTYTEHRDHDLVDFKQGISHHKETIEDNLRRCRQKMGELRNRLELVRTCETRILYAQNEIHSAALSYVDTIRQREKQLIEQLSEYYGDETTEYLKKKEDLESFLDQLKSTCNLTEMVVKGKDIELLLLKKQLCEKFEEFQVIHLDPIPKNIIRRVNFLTGSVDLGKLSDPEELTIAERPKPSGIAAAITAQGYSRSFDSSQDDDQSNDVKDEETKTAEESDKEFEEAEEDLADIQEVDEEEEIKDLKEDKSTQIGYRDLREILGERIRETEVQTDIRMIHELAAPSRTYDRRAFMASKTDNKEVQTDLQNGHNTPQLTSQSSLDDDTSPNAPVDRNKLGRRVRRHVKPGCSIAVLPNSEIIIIDPESNCISILDRRGKFRYGMSNSNKPCNENGHQPSSVQFNPAVFSNLAKLERGVRILTPQGVLTVKLDNEVLHDVRNVAAPATEQTSNHQTHNEINSSHNENQTNGHCASDTDN